MRGRGEEASGRGLTRVDPPAGPPLHLPPQGMTSRTSSLPGECRSHAQDCTHAFPAHLRSPITFASRTSTSSYSCLILSSLPFLCPLLLPSSFHLFSSLFPPTSSSLTRASLHVRLSPFCLVTFSCHSRLSESSSPSPLTCPPCRFLSPVTFASQPTALLPFSLLSLSRHSPPVPSASLSLRGRGEPRVRLTLDKDRVQTDAPGRSAGPRALRGGHQTGGGWGGEGRGVMGGAKG